MARVMARVTVKGPVAGPVAAQAVAPAVAQAAAQAAAGPVAEEPVAAQAVAEEPVAEEPVAAVGTPIMDAWWVTPRRAASATTETIPTITRASLVAELGVKAVQTPLGRNLAAARVVTTR
jgi:hypothetical protein